MANMLLAKARQLFAMGLNALLVCSAIFQKRYFLRMWQEPDHSLTIAWPMKQSREKCNANGVRRTPWWRASTD
jgi:hypothetical protein